MKSTQFSKCNAETCIETYGAFTGSVDLTDRVVDDPYDLKKLFVTKNIIQKNIYYPKYTQIDLDPLVELP